MGRNKAFTLAEAMITLLVVSILLAVMAPIVVKRKVNETTTVTGPIPIGSIVAWSINNTAKKAIPNNNWLECNGQIIPDKYQRLKELFGDKVPDCGYFRGSASIIYIIKASD